MNHQHTTLKASKTTPILLFSVFIIAICGLLYELLISSISAYFLGSSILHFSLTIGFFLTFMGLGAFLSKFLGDKNLLTAFILIEIFIILDMSIKKFGKMLIVVNANKTRFIYRTFGQN